MLISTTYRLPSPITIMNVLKQHELITSPPPSSLYKNMVCILWLALVGKDAVRYANHGVSYTTRVPFLYLFGGLYDGYRVRSYCARWMTLTRRRGNDRMIASRSVDMVRHPRGSYIVMPIAVSGVATPENEVTHWSLSSISKKVGTRCRRPSSERLLEGCSSPFMRLVEHLTALRA